MSKMEEFHKCLADCMRDNYFEISKLEWLLEMVKSNTVKYFKFEPIKGDDTPIYRMEIQFEGKEGNNE